MRRVLLSLGVVLMLCAFTTTKVAVAPGWTGSSQVNWGQPWASCPTNLSQAASIEVGNAYSQGYNCVCREEWQETVYSGGDFVGYVYYVRVTKSVTEACPCIGAY
jgi:hypothetical protein